MNLRILLVYVLGLLLLAAPTRADDAAVPEGLASSDWSSIRAAYEAGRHAVVADENIPGHYRARNPGQQWLTHFDGRGFSTTPSAGGWSWGLDLISYGRGDQQQTIDGTACVQTSAGRVEYEWNPSLTEWYINDQRGFEHGYTLKHRPDGVSGPGGMLHFTLAVRGDLHPRVSENGRDVAFTTTRGASDGGAAVVRYNNLKVFDADGVHLAASFQATMTAAGMPALRLTIDDTGARYPITIDPVAQQAYLKASNTGGGDWFGHSVAVSGDTVVIGAPFEDSNATGVNGNQADNGRINSGAAYVFVRSGTTWTQQAYLKASNTGVDDLFGLSVAVSGDTVVVGACLEDSSATGVNGNQTDNNSNDSGAVYVFVRSGTTWTQQAYLKASNTGQSDQFFSVAISGDTIVVGAPFEDGNATGVNGNQANDFGYLSGAAYVFVRTGTTWTQQAYLKASNTGDRDSFGISVAVSGDTVVVGAYGEDSSATGVDGNQADNRALWAGAAYVFVRSGTTWAQQAYLKASNTGRDDEFGISVAISGDTVVVGAYAEASNAQGVNGNQDNNFADRSGAVYVFVRPSGGTTWTQQAYLKASNTGAHDYFGISVDVLGDTIVVGAYQEDSNATGVNGNQANNNAGNSGAAYVFVRSGTTWTQQAYLKASNTGAGDQFGRAVAVSGDTVVVGATTEDSNVTGINGNQADNTATDSGAAYVFLLPLPTPTSPLAAPVTVCGGAPVALSVADPAPGVVIDWFANSCGGTLLGTGNPFIVNPVSTTTYFARARNPSSGSTSDACAAVVVTVGPMDYNRDAALNLDDVADFITDFYMDPPIPGGLQPAAATYADLTLGYGIGCPGAADAPAPFATDAYRASGYRVSFSPDGSNSCPVSPDQNFPNLDHLADFITEYYAAFTAAGC